MARATKTSAAKKTETAQVVNLAEAKSKRSAGRYKSKTASKPSATPQAMKMPGNHWLITAYCELEKEQYHYIAEEKKRGSKTKYRVSEVWPAEDGPVEVGVFAQLDAAMDEIEEALAEPDEGPMDDGFWDDEDED